MTALFFLVSFLWVFPSTYQAFDIPLQNALLIQGEPVGFSTPAPRQKRAEKVNVTVSCSSHDYMPRKRNYCCNKCLAGYRVAQDCSGDGQATRCVPCESGTFTDIPSNSKRCESCGSCLSQYGQIVLSECTAEKNIQCGCPVGQFKQYSGSDFTCQECSICHNGTEVLKCHDDKDTICTCFPHFFLDSNKRCRPCSECQEPYCTHHCLDPALSMRPDENNGTVLAVSFVATVIIMAMGAYLLYTYWKRKHSSSSESPSVESKPTPLSTSHTESEEKKLLNLPGIGYTQEDSTCVVQLPTNQPMDGSLPLPDITNGTAPRSLNSTTVVYAIIESIQINRWTEFVRRLGVSNYIIETSIHDNRSYREAQYAMLYYWITRGGCPTTKQDQMFRVLREMNMGGCIEKIEEHL